MTTETLNREKILRRFEHLLDAALADESPPAGIDPGILSAIASGEDAEADRRCDSYALWAAMTSLTQEVKLQGRAFQELNRALEARQRDLQRDLQREAERRCRRDVLGALIDLRDRLGRGRESARAREGEMREAAQGSWLSRIFTGRGGEAAGASIGALIRGYELGIERLDQTLEEFNAREIRCDGELFDPRRMNAIDSAESPGAPEGTVLEVYRSGYEWDGEVFRPAQVKVSRAPGAGKAHE